MKKISALFIGIIMLLALSNNTNAQIDSCWDLVIPDIPEQGYNNPDLVYKDTCQNSNTFNKLYAKQWFEIIFYVDPFKIPLAPEDTIIEVPWTQIDTNYQLLRQQFQQLETDFGNFIFRKKFPEKTDTNYLQTKVYLISFSNYVEIDTIISILLTLNYIKEFKYRYNIYKNLMIPNDPVFVPGKGSDYFYSEDSNPKTKFLGNNKLDKFGFAWNHYVIKLPMAWEITLGSSDIIIAFPGNFDKENQLNNSNILMDIESTERWIKRDNISNLGNNTDKILNTIGLGHGLAVSLLCIPKLDNNLLFSGIASKCKYIFSDLSTFWSNLDISSNTYIQSPDIINFSSTGIEASGISNDLDMTLKNGSVIVGGIGNVLETALDESIGKYNDTHNSTDWDNIKTSIANHLQGEITIGDKTYSLFRAISKSCSPASNVILDDPETNNPDKDIKYIGVAGIFGGDFSSSVPSCIMWDPRIITHIKDNYENQDFDLQFQEGNLNIIGSYIYSLDSKKFSISNNTTDRKSTKTLAQVDLVAPALYVFSSSGNYLEYNHGASFAAPQVSGVVALMRSVDKYLGNTLNEWDVTGHLVNGESIHQKAYNILTFTAKKILDNEEVVPDILNSITNAENTETLFYYTDYYPYQEHRDGDKTIQYNYRIQDYVSNNLQYRDPLRRSWAQRMGFGMVNAFRAVLHATPKSAKGKYQYTSNEPLSSNFTLNGKNIIHFGGIMMEGDWDISDRTFNEENTGSNNDLDGSGSMDTVLVLEHGGRPFPGANISNYFNNSNGETLIDGGVTLTVNSGKILGVDGILRRTPETPLTASKVESSSDGLILITGYLADVEVKGKVKVDDLEVHSTNESGYGKLNFTTIGSEIYGKVVLNESSKIIVSSGTLTIQPGGSVELNGTQDIEINSGATLEMAYASSIKASDAQKIIIKPGGRLVIKEGAMVHLDCEVYIDGLDANHRGELIVEKNTLVYSNKITLTQYGTLTLNEGAIIMPETGKTGKIVLEEGVNFEVNNSSWTERLALIGGIDVKPGATLRVKEGSKLDLGPFNIEGFIINSNAELVQGGTFFVERLSNIKLFGVENTISGYFETGINANPANPSERSYIGGFSGEDSYKCFKDKELIFAKIKIQHNPFIFKPGSPPNWLFNPDYVRIKDNNFENITVIAINAITRLNQEQDIINCSFTTNTAKIKESSDAQQLEGYSDQSKLPTSFLDIQNKSYKIIKPPEMPSSTWNQWLASNQRHIMLFKETTNTSFKDENLEENGGIIVYNRPEGENNPYHDFDGLSVTGLYDFNYFGIGTSQEGQRLFENLNSGMNIESVFDLNVNETYFYACLNGIISKMSQTYLCLNKFENNKVGTTFISNGLGNSFENQYQNTQYGSRLDFSRHRFRGCNFNNFLSGIIISERGKAILDGWRGSGIPNDYSTDIGGCVFDYHYEEDNINPFRPFNTETELNRNYHSDILFDRNTAFAYLPCGFNTMSVSYNTNGLNFDNWHLNGTEKYSGQVGPIITLNNWWSPNPPGNVRFNPSKVTITPPLYNQHDTRYGCEIGTIHIGPECYNVIDYLYETVPTPGPYLDNPSGAKAKFYDIIARINNDSLNYSERETNLEYAMMLAPLSDSSEYCLRKFIDTLDVIIADTLYPSSHRRGAYFYKGQCFERLNIIDTANLVYDQLLQDFPSETIDNMYAEWRLQYNNCRIIDSTYGQLYDSCLYQYNKRVFDDITRISISQPKKPYEDEEFQLNDMKSSEEKLAIRLKQNQPNPFSSLTEIQYFINITAPVQLSLYNYGGKEICRLIDKYVAGGWHSIIVNGTGLSNGIYILRLSSGNEVVTKTINRLE